jgi:4-hydroxy-2-oxoglutarate aldolase
MANCLPNPIAQVQELFNADKLDESRELYQRYFPVNAAVTGAFGIPGLKYSTAKMGYTGGYVRNPLIDSSDEDKKKLDVIIDTAVNG